MAFHVDSPTVQYTEEKIRSEYSYQTSDVTRDSTGKLIVKPKTVKYEFEVERKVPRVGCMLVGWGGNNGSTITGAVLANKLNLSWPTKKGKQVRFWKREIL